MIKHRLRNGKEVAILENDSHISNWVKESGRLDHDQSMLPLLAKYIPKGGTVIDVGAFIGDHTIYYANRVGQHGTVIAFEPNTAPFQCLQFNMRPFEQVKVLNKGASYKKHRISISQCDNVGASRPIDGNDFECITIDSLKLERCDFIKMDCEGFEVYALSGAYETIDKHRPVMLIEINDGALAASGFSRKDIFEFLEEKKYTYRNVYEGHSMDGVQLDIICLPN